MSLFPWHHGRVGDSGNFLEIFVPHLSPTRLNEVLNEVPRAERGVERGILPPSMRLRHVEGCQRGRGAVNVVV